MKISEIIVEQADPVEIALQSNITFAKQKGVKELNTAALAAQLSNLAQGHEITPEDIVNMLANNQNIAQANTTSITLAYMDTKSSTGDAEKSAKKVEKLASKSALKGVKK